MSDFKLAVNSPTLPSSFSQIRAEMSAPHWCYKGRGNLSQVSDHTTKTSVLSGMQHPKE